MTKQENWNRFKAKSIRLGKTITQVARDAGCSTRAVRVAVTEDRFPKVRANLKKMGLVR